MDADDFSIDHDVSSEADDSEEFEDELDQTAEAFDEPDDEDAAESGESDADDANRRDHRRALRIYGAVTALFAASVVGLGLFGYQRSIDLTGGINPEAAALDRDQPGYEATVKSTAVTLLVVTKADGKLASVSVSASRPAEDGGGGTMMVLPLKTLVEHVDKPADTFETTFARGGIDQLRVDVELAIGFGVSSTIVLNPSQLAAALQQGVPIVNPDTLYVTTASGDRTIAFDSGQITIAPDRAADYLGLLAEGDNAVNQINRSELFWSAVLTGKRTSDNAASADLMPGAVVPTTAPTAGASGAASGASGATGASSEPAATGVSGTSGATGDTGASGDSGASGDTGASGDSPAEPTGSSGAATTSDSETSGTVAKGTALLAELQSPSSAVFRAPSEEVPLGIPGGITLSTFRVEQAELNQQLADFVPIPPSAFDGQRPTVLLLNGTTKLDQQLQFIDKIVGAGSTITAVGNAQRLDLKKSTVEYFDEADKAGAEKVAASLGLAANRSTDTRKFDVVVTIGSDLLS